MVCVVLNVKYTNLILAMQQPLHDLNDSMLDPQSLLLVISTDTIITDASVHRCLKPFNCEPYAGDDTWAKYPTPLNLYLSSMFNHFLYVRRQQAVASLRFVLDIQLGGPMRPLAPVLDRSQWIEKTNNGFHLWLRVLLKDEGIVPVEDKLIRDVNLLYGDYLDDARPYWDFNKEPNVLPYLASINNYLSLLKVAQVDKDSIMQAEAEFQLLKSNDAILSPQPLFKILQVSDLHFGQDRGQCFGDVCKQDSKTLRFMEDAIAKEQPQFIVITGDLLDFPRIKNFRSAILKALAPILKSGVPFVFTFGELDYSGQDSDSKLNFLRFVLTLPNCYNTAHIDDKLHGLTNYNIRVYYTKPGDSVDTVSLTSPDALISVLDSQDNRVDLSQINYLYRYNKQINSEIFKLLFFHYPLPNFRPIGKFKLIGGYREKHRLETETDVKFKDDLINCGYNVVSVGHEHENDACIVSPDERGQVKEDPREIWLCYSSITGESGETKLNPHFKRKVRIFEINFDKRQLLSWKMEEFAEAGFDHQMIHEFGSPGF